MNNFEVGIDIWTLAIKYWKLLAATLIMALVAAGGYHIYASSIASFTASTVVYINPEYISANTVAAAARGRGFSSINTENSILTLKVKRVSENEAAEALEEKLRLLLLSLGDIIPDKTAETALVNASVKSLQNLLLEAPEPEQTLVIFDLMVQLNAQRELKLWQDNRGTTLVRLVTTSAPTQDNNVARMVAIFTLILLLGSAAVYLLDNFHRRARKVEAHV